MELAICVGQLEYEADGFYHACKGFHSSTIFSSLRALGSRFAKNINL
jgi:hypothetical protein